MNRAKYVREPQHLRIAVGLSGGVDSAVSAMLLARAGYEVVGVHLYCWPPKSEIERDGLTREEWIKKNGCRADEDRQAALKTALELSIPFKVLDFSEEYNKKVVDYFYREYEAGRTPNPDVLCNSEIKFGLFLQWALENGFDYIATGHYAKLGAGSRLAKSCARTTGSRVRDTGSLRAVFAGASAPANSFAEGPTKRGEKLASITLSIPKDKHKDQTYFLWKLTQKELAHVMFPLADLTKPEVRKLAKEAGLSVANRPDSQGICFVGNVEAREFLARRLKEVKGDVRNTKGEKIGEHIGVWFYTIGQRGGWQMSAKAQKQYMESGETPVFYVIGKDAKKNELTVGLAEEAWGEEFKISEVNEMENLSGDCLARIRHGGKLIPAKIEDKKVALSEKQRGIAPGQSVVFYNNDGVVLGGGVIC